MYRRTEVLCDNCTRYTRHDSTSRGAPWDDVAEQKRSTEGLGCIRMTGAVRVSLFVLRASVIAITLMLRSHVLKLARGHHPIH